MAEILHIGLQPVADRSWMGGVNYIINLACALKKALGSRVSVSLCLTREGQLPLLPLYADAFQALDRFLFVGFRPQVKSLPRPAVHCPEILDLYSQIDFLYPGIYNHAQVLEAGYPSAGWLTDFQHKHLPEFFSASELTFRDRQERAILSAGGPVFFSSQSALEDARRYYPEYSPPMRVLHFHTAADSGWYQMEPAEVRRRHNLPEKYLICCNQFWMHKNHLVLFQSLKLLRDSGHELTLACTGDTADHRNPAYFAQLRQELTKLGVQEQVRFLGVLPRTEQMALMRGSLAVLQPSRFEGWSTVVEDARLLGKTIFLSAIPVHLEQNPEFGIFFQPTSADDLAAKLRSALPSLHPGPDVVREEQAKKLGEELIVAFGRRFYELVREACCLVPPPYGLPADLALPSLTAPFSGLPQMEQPGVAVVTALRTDLADHQLLHGESAAEYQKRCIASWLTAGFAVLSCNTPQEAQTLQEDYPQVQFVQAGLRGLDLLPTKAPRITQMLRATLACNKSVCGILEPCVLLRNPAGLREQLRSSFADACPQADDSPAQDRSNRAFPFDSTPVKEQGQTAALFLSRIAAAGTDDSFVLPGEFDGVFLPRARVLTLESCELRLTAPWWPAWLAHILLLRGGRLFRCEGFTCRPTDPEQPDPQLSQRSRQIFQKTLNYVGALRPNALPRPLQELLMSTSPEPLAAAKTAEALQQLFSVAGDLPEAPQQQRHIVALKSALERLLLSADAEQTQAVWKIHNTLFRRIAEYEHLQGFLEAPACPRTTMLEAIRAAVNTNGWTAALLLRSLLRLPALDLPPELWPPTQVLQSLLPVFVEYVFRSGSAPDHPGDTDRLPAILITGYRRLQTLCEEGYAPEPALLEACFNSPHILQAYASSRPLREVMQSRANMLAAFQAKRLPTTPWQPAPAQPRPRLRLGVFLKMFAPHTETYATIPFFSGLDRSRFEIRLYVQQETHAPVEARCRRLADAFIVLNGDFPARLQRLRADDLDLLLIGTNATAVLNDAVMLGFQRVARKQLVQFCQPCTTGLPCMDGFLAGETLELDPSDFTERLHLLSGSGICFDSGADEDGATTAQKSRAQFGIPAAATAFFSGANYFKLCPELLGTWAHLLARTPNSVLVLLPYGPAWSSTYPGERLERLLHQACLAAGIERKRILIQKALPSRGDVRQLIGLCDVYLDSFPYSGATSLLDPLALGVPVVAMASRSVCGAQGAGMLRDCGLAELVAQDEEAYLQLAIRLAGDATYREKIGNKMRALLQNGAPFYDLSAFARKLEPVYEQIAGELR